MFGDWAAGGWMEPFLLSGSSIAFAQVLNLSVVSVCVCESVCGFTCTHAYTLMSLLFNR